MHQIGIVKSATEKNALVEVRRMSACSGCHKRNPGTEPSADESFQSCRECSIFPQETEMTVCAVNEIGAQPGEHVVISSESRLILGYAGAVFLLPLLLAFVLGCVFAFVISAAWGGYLGAVIGFAGAFFVVKMTIDRHAAQKTVYTIIKRVKGGTFSADDIQNMEN